MSAGTLAVAGRRVAVSLAWSRSPRQRTVTQVGAPAMMPSMTPSPLSFTERASKAGQASAAAKTADERVAAARTAANAANGLPSLARRVAKVWDGATDDERREARRVLREAGVIR